MAIIGFSATVQADVVTDWNMISISAVAADRVANRQSRDMAMVTRPSIIDPEWLASLDEVRAYGASDSTVRTAAQLEIDQRVPLGGRGSGW